MGLDQWQVVELKPAQKVMIRELYCGGDNVPAALADRSEYHRKSIQRSLSELNNAGVVKRKNEYGVWTLSAAGLEEARRMMFEK